MTLESRSNEASEGRLPWIRRSGLALQAATASAIAVFLAIKFNGMVSDDAMITFRYSKNLANGLGFVFNPGERVMSTTTPLSAVVFGVPELFDVRAQGASVVVSAGLLAATGFIICRDLWHIEWKAAAWAALIGIPLSAYLIGVLPNEMPSYLLVSTVSLLLVVRRRPQWAVPIAALTLLIRPDGIVLLGLVLVACAWLAWRDQTLRRPLVRGTAVAAVGLALCAITIRSYFGRTLPVTLAAKQAQGDTGLGRPFLNMLGEMLRNQLDLWWMKPVFVLLFLGVVVLVVMWRRLTSTIAPLLIAWSVLFGAAFARSGTPGHEWYAAPVVLGCCVLVALGAQAPVLVAAKLRLGGRAAAVVGVAAVGVVAVGAAGTVRSALTIEGPLYHTNLYEPAAAWLQANTPPDASVGTPEVGIIGYHSDRTIVDFAGLLQPDVPANYDRDLGFEGFATYALRTYEPDYVVLLQGMWTTVIGLPEFTGACTLATTITEPGVLEALDIYRCTYPDAA